MFAEALDEKNKKTTLMTYLFFTTEGIFLPSAAAGAFLCFTKSHKTIAGLQVCTFYSCDQQTHLGCH